jgi:hypothetical protein
MLAALDGGGEFVGNFGEQVGGVGGGGIGD